jgi:PadR family transcriptional regulator PadR
LSGAVLEALDGRPRHGYELYDVLVSSGFRMGDRALVYHELHLLQRTGLVASHLDVSSPGPARRVYALTTAGRQMLSRARRQSAATNGHAVDV